MDQVTPPAHPPACCCHTEHLTEHELRILRHIAAGATNAKIAASLGISTHTVAGHLRTMLHRSQANNRAELVARAYAARIITPDVWPPTLTGRRCLQLPAPTPVPQRPQNPQTSAADDPTP